MGDKLTILLAVEEFELYHLYNEIIDSYIDDLEDPSVSDLRELLEEYDNEFEFVSDTNGDYTKSFERNLREAIATIIESVEDLSFVDDEFENDGIPEIYGENFENDSGQFDLDTNNEDEYEN